jgi:choline transport protein
MALTMLIGMVTAFMWTLAFMFSASDLEAVSTSYLPILTVYSQTLLSEGAAAFFAVWLLFICKFSPHPVSKMLLQSESSTLYMNR